MTPLTAFLLGIALKATLILAVTALLHGAMLRRRASAAARHLLWCVAITGLLLLPILGALLPGWSPVVIAVPAPAEVQVVQPMPLAAAQDYAMGAPAAPAVLPRIESPPQRGSAGVALPAPGTILLGLYFAGVVLLLLKVAAEQWIVRRLSRAATPVQGREWGELLDSVRGTLGVRRPIALLRSGAPTIPITWGVLRPAVLLPADADEWTEPRRRAVLLHEVAHIARHDCLTQALAAVACAVYWPHPGVWWAASRMRVERELACDDHALARGVPPREYAGHLLELARGLHVPGAPTAALPMASASNLESRLQAALDGSRNRAAPGRRARALGALLAAVLLVPVAVVRPGAAREAALPEARAPEPVPVAAPPKSVAPAPVPAAASPSSQEADAGTWRIRPAGRGEAETGEPAVHVMVNTNGLTTFVVPLRQMEGLAAAQLASSGDSARFRLRRDGGTFAFRGVFRAGRGSGRFAFIGDPAFAAGLARRGIGEPTPRQLFSMALHDVSFALVEELAKQGYATPTPDALVRLGVSGADLRYLREMSALGYRFGTTGALVSFSNSGVTPPYVRALAQLGYRDLPAADIVRLRNHSLEADTIRQLNERAGRRLSVSELVATRMRGAALAPAAVLVSMPPSAPAPEPEPAPRPSSSSTPLAGEWVIFGTRDGFANLRLNWDDGTNWDRWVPISALRGTTAGQMASAGPVAFRIAQDAGVLEFDGSFRGGRGSGRLRFHPNRAFAATLRSLGVAGADEVTDHNLKNLTWGGISAEEVRGFRAAGLTPFDFRGLVDLAVFQVTPRYAQELAGLGYRGLSSAQLIDLWRARVTPRFVRVVQQSRGEGTPLDSLIQIRGRIRN